MENENKFSVTEVIDLKRFLSSWDDTVFQDCAHDANYLADNIKNRMGLDAETIKELEAPCSIDHLKCGEEPLDKWKVREEIPENMDLMSIRYQKSELQKRKTIPMYANKTKFAMKYKIGETRMRYDPRMESADIPEESQVIYPDIVLTVYIHRPYFNWKNDTKTVKDKLIADHTFLVLGRQKLTELRDYIRCVNDLAIAGDLSENPDSANQNYAKDIFKSGFFFFEGVFHDDMREQDCRQYSKDITRWAKENSVGNYTCRKMEETTFLDLKIRLGQPYVYMHQGNCEHIIVFSDLRLLMRDDPQDIRDYPYLIRKHKSNRTICVVCNTHTARWIVYDSEFAPESPCFFCEQCFRCLHYDVKGKKIGTFKAYRFFDSHAIV